MAGQEVHARRKDSIIVSWQITVVTTARQTPHSDPA